MRQLNFFYKLCIGCAVALGLLFVGQFVFVLMPLYRVVGEDSAKAVITLERADTVSSIISVLIYFFALVMVAAALLGARKNVKHSKHGRR